MLARRPEDLSVWEVVEAVQGPVHVTGRRNPSAGTDGSIRGDRTFGTFWSRIDEVVARLCRETSIADLVEQEIAQHGACSPNYAI